MAVDDGWCKSGETFKILCAARQSLKAERYLGFNLGCNLFLICPLNHHFFDGYAAPGRYQVVCYACMQWLYEPVVCSVLPGKLKNSPKNAATAREMRFFYCVNWRTPPTTPKNRNPCAAKRRRFKEGGFPLP